MASEIQVPCDSEGVCMRCKVNPPTEETLMCSMCATPWHVACLSSESLVSDGDEWKCPDCSGDVDLDPVPVSGTAGAGSSLVAAIREIEADESLTEAEKAKRRQKLMSGGQEADDVEEEECKKKKGVDDDEDILAVVRQNFNCSICLQLPERPVTTACGHNFCLKCFQKWTGRGKFTCAKCRSKIPRKAARNLRVNLAVVSAIRLAMNSKCATEATVKVNHFIHNQDLPVKAYTTERAVLSGDANAASGKILVTIPRDHFGPIPAENDPIRNLGVLVGETWKGRQECKQWGAHFPHVSGIAGQSKHGAQSVALSGGYEDSLDHGEWFIYTGSGGRDLGGNKRTNRKQSFDQEFTKANEALRISCKMGYPVRVVRSQKEKRSVYAPEEEKSVRYDGVYRVEMCWRKIGIQDPFMVCRYLFVRCDNEPAPWTRDEHGDRPRPLPNVPELEQATDLFVREESPSWDFDEADNCWKWVKPPPASRKAARALDPAKRKRTRNAKNMSMRDRLLKEFSCQICRKVMNLPVTTPCAHNFCKACLEAKFAGISRMRERSRGGRTLRAKKNVMMCPACPTDLSDFLENPQVNREVMDVIEKLTKKEEEPVVVDDAPKGEIEENSENTTESNAGGNVDIEDEEEEEEEDEEEEEEEDDDDDSDEDGDDEEEGNEVVEDEAEEPASKRMKLDSDTEAAATATV